VLLGTAAGACALIYLFIVLIDPWGMLPWSLPLHRVPISTNARFSHPALAIDPAFDSIVLGTSTSRMLRPALLDKLFGRHFANLAMNSATPWEQSQMLALFLRHHPHPGTILIGLDEAWCAGEYMQLTPREFPAWMYRPGRWRGYLQMFNLYALEEAVNQLAVQVGLKRPPLGQDGFTSFVPDDRLYDPVRAQAHLDAERAPADPAWPASQAALVFPSHPLLAEDLTGIPPGTEIILYFVPYYLALQPPPGSGGAARWAECKRRVRSLAQEHHALLADFMRPSPITRVATQYWDPRHPRAQIADRLARDLVGLRSGRLGTGAADGEADGIGYLPSVTGPPDDR